MKIHARTSLRPCKRRAAVVISDPAFLTGSDIFITVEEPEIAADAIFCKRGSFDENTHCTMFAQTP